jgi:hypothetical protein
MPQAVFAQFRYPARGGFFGFFEPLYAGVDVCLGQRAVEVDARLDCQVHLPGGRATVELRGPRRPASLVGADNTPGTRAWSVRDVRLTFYSVAGVRHPPGIR